MNTNTDISWEPKIKDNLNLFVSKMPLFHRRMAEELISEQAVANAKKRNANLINEEDLLCAIFSGVPSPFYTIMVRLLDELKFDYKKYGLPKSPK